MPTYTTQTAAETESLAEKLLPEILNKRVIQLSGNLGSGKTTFVKGLARALGIEQAIKSPTYTYVQSYKLPTTLRVRATSESRTNYKMLSHFDLYRLPETSEHPEDTLASIGLEEALNDPLSIVVIEWPERIPLKTPSLHLHFEKKDKEHHIILKEDV